MKKTGVFTRLLSAILMLAMVVPLAPLSAGAEGVTAQYGYVVINNNSKNRVVNFRPEPGSTNYIDQLAEGWVVEILGETTKNKMLWYQAKNPKTGDTGYLMASFVQKMTANEQADWLLNPTDTIGGTAGGSGGLASVLLPATGTPYGYVLMTADQVTVYDGASQNYPLNPNAVDKLPRGYIVAYFALVTDYLGVQWVQVNYNGGTGFIRSDCYTYTTETGNVSILPGASAGTGTGGGTVIVPGTGTEIGYIRLTVDKVNLRAAPAGKVLTEKEADKLPLGTVLAYYEKVTRDKYDWVKVLYNGQVGYIRSDCYGFSDSVGNLISASPSPAPPSPPPPIGGVDATIGYVKLTEDKVYLRLTPGGTVLNQKDLMPLGKIFGYTAVTSYGGYQWVKIVYNGMTGYVRSDCYMYCDEFGAPLVTPTPTPHPTSVVPGITVPPVIGDGTYGRINTDNVMFRKVMNTNGDYWARLPRNWTVGVLGSEMKGTTLWYKVQSGTPANPTRTYTGYIHGDYLTLMNGVTATPAPSGTGRYGQITINGINVRQTPGGTALTALLYGTVVNIIQYAAGSTANDWYYIEYNGIYGYVEGSALRVLPQSEEPYVTLPPPPAPTTTPSPTPAFTGTGYVKLMLDKVNIRKTPGGTVLTPTEGSKLPLGLILAYSEGPVVNGRYSWVKITYAGKTGYIRSDCYIECDSLGNVSLATATPAPTSGVTGQSYIRLIKGGVNLRSGVWGKPLGQLDKDTILPYFSIKLSGSETWYEVYSAKLGCNGYILGTMAVICDVSGGIVVPTLAPTTTPGGSGSYTSYVATSISSVWLRSSPNVNAGTSGKVSAKGTVLPMTGAAVVSGLYTWYPVQLPDGTRGYLRGDCAYQLADWQLDYYTKYGTCPTPTPGPATPPPGNSDYIITTGDKLWVRETPSKKAGTVGQLALGAVVKFTKKQIVGNILWYQITINGKSGWVHGDFARVMTNAEYYAWKGTNAPSSTPTAMPDPATFSDMGLTTGDRVKIRGSASMSGAELSLVYDAGSKVTYLGRYSAPTAINPYYWFNVKYGGVSGWMRGDFVRILTVEEKRLYTLTGDPDAPKEATYRTLSKGSTGEDVTALQNKLVEKGYLAASEVSGVYLTSTENAVIAFQRASRLTVDGIAGEKTQHMLFGTVPEGTYDGSSATPMLYPVEKIDWYTGGIQSIWSVGTVAVITDVYTGISFRAQRLYGDNHADCEPKTTADTAAVCQIYGVSNAQEISDRESELQSWRRRPLWVTIGGRTFCASMYGIPHNYAGDRIPDNNYNGQFCVHFTNSMTHGSGSLPAQVDKDASYNGNFGHQSAIQYAYSHSQSGTK